MHDLIKKGIIAMAKKTEKERKYEAFGKAMSDANMRYMTPAEKKKYAAKKKKKK